MVDNYNSSTIPPWYKQFWPWFLIALPGSVVIASIITIFIAVDTSDTVVDDNYYKEGLAINRDLSRQQQAEKLDIRASLQFNDEALRVQLKTPNADKTEGLLLRFTHPTLSNQDQQISLSMIAPTIYQGNIKTLSNGLWNVALLPKPSNWEIKTRIKIESGKVLYTIR